MTSYVDSSALLKRVLAEAQSGALEDHLEAVAAAGGALVTSSLAVVEVTRALLRREDGGAGGAGGAARLAADALAGVATAPLGAEVVALARRCGPAALGSLDALHLATALLLDVDEVVVYDARLRAAAAAAGLVVSSPGE